MKLSDKRNMLFHLLKNVGLKILLPLIMIACEDVIEVEVPEGPERLVVDASFEFYFNEAEASDAENGIKLSLTSPFFSETIPPVSNAIVFITDDADGTRFDFIESFNAGFYISANDDFIPQFDRTYTLTIIYNNETYVATTQLIPSVPIDNVEQGDDVLFDGDETELIITFTDDGSRDDFYLFDFDFDLYLPSEDRFYQGQTFPFSYFYEDMVGGEIVTIKILGIEERFFNYMTLLIEQSEQDGNPFQSPPVQLRGNIINTDNPDNIALGYFNLAEGNRVNFTIEEK